MSKDEFGDINFMYFMDLNWYSFPIVRDCDLGFVDMNIYLCHFLVTLIVVCRIYHNFIKNFVKTSDVFDLFLEEGLVLEDPESLLVLLYRTDVGIWTDENVFDLTDFAVGFFDLVIHGANM